MKKLFAKTDTSAQQYVGKVFTVGRFTVTIEDVIAEMNILIFMTCNDCLVYR
jgi:hypothetical protein